MLGQTRAEIVPHYESMMEQDDMLNKASVESYVPKAHDDDS